MLKKKKKIPDGCKTGRSTVAVEEVKEEADSKQRGEKKMEREGEMEDEQPDEDWGWI